MKLDGLQVLFVEDDELVRRAHVQSLELAGFSVRSFDCAEPVREQVSPDFLGIVVTDVRLPGLSGLDLLAHCQAVAPDVPLILVTGHGDISMAVEAMRGGAYDFIEKPFAAERLISIVRRALERRTLLLENRELRRVLGEKASGTSRILGDSPAIEQVRRLVANVAPTDAPVLINGDTGAGKELIARSLHDLSTRHAGPFIALNCAALPESIFESEMFGHEAGAFTGAAKRRIGKLEHASGGTLFLDEIESMPPALQVKLLRVLQDGMIERLGANQSIRVDCRLVAAAKGDLKQLVDAGTFRRDLFYRLNVVTIALPPLAERREDIMPLFESFVLEAAVRYQRPVPRIADHQRLHLLQHDWPGNVRELRNAAERLVLGVGEALGAAREESCAEGPLRSRVERFEQAVIADTLQQCGGAVALAAERLQLSKATLYEKMKRYGLQARAADGAH